MISTPPRRSRHEEQVAAFLTTCDPAKVAEVEAKYVVNDRDCLSDLERTWSPEYMDSHPVTEGYPHRIVPGEAARIRTSKKRATGDEVEVVIGGHRYSNPPGVTSHDSFKLLCHDCGDVLARCTCQESREDG